MRKGTRHSTESKEKLSLALMGNRNGIGNKSALGHHHTDEAREKIRIATTGKKNAMWGKSPSGETRKKLSLALKGRRSNHWKGGVIKGGGGRRYVLEFVPDHPYASKRGYVLRHRLIVERFLGRYLTPEEVVHHCDGNPNNNSLENLKVFTGFVEHMKTHHVAKKGVATRSARTNFADIN